MRAGRAGNNAERRKMRRGERERMVREGREEKMLQ